MALETVCDGCRKKETGKKAGDGWRTLVMDLGYLPNCVEHGTCDELFEMLLCAECHDLLDFDRLQLAVLTAVSREASRE